MTSKEALRIERLLDRKNELVTIMEDRYGVLDHLPALRKNDIPYILNGTDGKLAIQVAPEDELRARYALNLITEEKQHD